MTPSVIEIFTNDARKYGARLRNALEGEAGGPDADMLRRASKRLHHAALLANQEAVLHAAAVLQKTAVQLLAGKRSWTTELAGQIETVLLDLDTLVAGLPDVEPEVESRLRRAADRVLGVESSGEASGAAAEGIQADGGTTDPGARAEADAELEALIEDLDEAVDRLQNDPRDREPLKAMLRRIRKLRDLGRIQVMSPPDRALSAVEELILQIADLNATVGPGYLTVFRHAREVLEEMRDAETGGAGVTHVGAHAVEVDELKEKVIETARRARQVIWVSDLFYDEGPHIARCAVAEAESGSWEGYFLSEAKDRLERSETLRRQMLESSTEQMRLSGESLATTLRHLRERAVAFNHPGIGRVTRRAAAALRAQLVRPPSRLRALAEGLGGVVASLRHYLEVDDVAGRERAIADADMALHAAVRGDQPEAAISEAEFDPDRALQQALALRTRIDEQLDRLSGPAAEGLRSDLEELFELIAYYVSASAGRH